jgi:hypothetical protein
MSLNVCIDCNFEKKKCKCVVEPPKKVSWWRRIFFWTR